MNTVTRLNSRFYTAAIVALIVSLFAAALAAVPEQASAEELAVGSGQTVVSAQSEATFVYFLVDGSVHEYASDDEGGEIDGGAIAVEVHGKTSGDASYDSSSGTLSVTDLHAAEIVFSRAGATTLKLEGANVLSQETSDTAISVAGSATELVIAGDGSLEISYPKGKGATDGAFVLEGTSKKGVRLTVEGGTVSMSEGIVIKFGDFKMTGGTVSIGSMELTCVRKKGKPVKYGTVTLTGGELSVNGRIDTDGHMKNEASCLKKVGGELPLGASFSVGGNQYRYHVFAEGKANEMRYIKLTKYNASSKVRKFGSTVKFGKYKYWLKGVAKNAFNTPAGKKVKKLTFKGTLSFIDAKAFAGTKSLTQLTFDPPFGYQEQTTADSSNPNGYRVIGHKFYWSNDATSVAKKAFAGCGKAGGKKLVVKPLKYKGPKDQSRQWLKSQLVKRGLNRQARIA